MTIAANIGETAILKFPACFPDSVVGIIPNDGNTLYMNYLLEYSKKQLLNSSEGVAQKNLNVQKIQEFQLMQHLSEKDRIQIGKLLSSMDELIENKEKLILNAESSKSYYLNKIFNDKFLGELEYLELGDIASIRTGFTPPTKDSTNFEEDLVWYGVVDMNTKYISSSGRMISNKCFKKNKFVKSGTLLMSFKLSVGRLAFTTVDCFTNEAIANFKFNEGISDNYMYYVLENIDIESYGSRGAQGVTLNSTSLNSIIVPIPNYSKQIEVANYLSNLGELIHLYKNEVEELKHQKQYYLNQIFG